MGGPLDLVAGAADPARRGAAGRLLDAAADRVEPAPAELRRRRILRQSPAAPAEPGASRRAARRAGCVRLVPFAGAT